MRVAKVITLTVEERASLTKWARGRSTPTRLVLRAKIVLAASDGKRNDEIAAELGCTRRTVGTWRNRFVADRLAGIERDAPRSGRTPSVRALKEADVIAKTTRETPAHATQWSVRTMAQATGVSKATVQRIWRDNGLKPHRVKSFKVSNDPRFVEQLVDVFRISPHSKLGQRAAELCLRDGAVTILVPAVEESDDALRLVDERRSQLVGHRSASGCASTGAAIADRL